MLAPSGPPRLALPPHHDPVGAQRAPYPGAEEIDSWPRIRSAVISAVPVEPLLPCRLVPRREGAHPPTLHVEDRGFDPLVGRQGVLDPRAGPAERIREDAEAQGKQIVRHAGAGGCRVAGDRLGDAVGRLKAKVVLSTPPLQGPLSPRGFPDRLFPSGLVGSAPE